MSSDARLGVGRSGSRDSAAAGREAATAALAQLGAAPPSLVLVFATAGHDQAALLGGVVSVTGAAPLSGCSAEGVITREGSDESSHAVAVMAVASPEITVDTFSVPGFAAVARRAGLELASRIAERGRTGRLLLLFPDGITGNCAELLEGLEGRLPFPVTIAGGTAGDLLTFQRTFQYHDGVATSDSVSAVLLGGDVEVELAVSHGCDLVGHQQTITRAERGLVYEIDHQPAWGLFKSYLAEDADTLEAMHIAHILLAERLPDVGGAIDGFTVRVPVRLDADSGALFFAAGMRTGTAVQVALRNPEKVCDHAVETAQALRARRPGQEPLVLLHLECAGRGRLLFGDEATARLIRPVQQVFGEHVPCIGLHTYGEIAPVGSRTCFHNYTGVLCALYATSR